MVSGQWSVVSGVNLKNRTFLGWCGHAFDPRETRENTREGRRGANLNNRTVLGRHRGVRGEGIKSQKCASVPAYQQFPKIYMCVRARVYLWKLLVRWYAGTLARWHAGGEAGCDCGRVSKQYSVHLETYFFLLFLRNYLRISFFCCIFAESFFDCACAPCYEFHV